MKRSLNAILAATLASHVLVVSAPAHADRSPAGIGSSIRGIFVRETFNLVLPNGDKIVLTPKRMMSNASIQFQRRDQSTPSESSFTPLAEVFQIAGPSSIFQGTDQAFRDKYKPLPISETPTGINTIYVRGRNGVLVIGQMNQLSPAVFFWHFIPKFLPNFVAEVLPVAQMTYMLPPDEGKTPTQQKSVNVGIVMGFKDGKTLTRTFSVSMNNSISPASTEDRRALASDEKFLKVPFKNGVFELPPELEGLVGISEGDANTDHLIGVDKYRANSRRGDGILKELRSKIFGQDSAIERIVFHIRKTFTTPMQKPKVLVAMGPSGVGKTFTAQLIAKRLYGDASRFMEIQGNMFNAHAGSLQSDELFGSPKGVKDAHDGSLVTWLRALKGQPGLLLINEGDKMHKDTWVKFMELLDQGKLTDRNGKVIEAKNIIVMITTNRGATAMFPSTVADWSQSDIDKRLLTLDKNSLKGYYLSQQGLKDENTLPREILNRIDDYIAFGPFSKEAAVKIAHLAAKDLTQEYLRNYTVKVEFDEKAITHMALAGWTAADDARQIREQVSNATFEAFDVAVHKLGVQNNGTINVTYGLNPANRSGYKITVGDQSAFVEGARIISNNPLKNPELAAKLLTLATEMKKTVIGQDSTIDYVADAVVSHAARPEKNRPLVVGLLGVSGNGKTETARALANARYDGHISILSMGEISNTSDFDKKFGSSAQFQGGDVMREFELALKNNPDGGVIVFDEISNMGGANPELRAALLMKLYNIFEEGIFTSPIDNKVYRLDKYIFVMTGNESEGLFANMSSDDNLKSTWEENKAPEKVRERLTEAKYPVAFINRAKWFLMKPLLSTEIHTVTKKLWDREAEAFMKENAGLKITTSKNFFDRVSHAYFTPDKGGRSVRDIFEDKIGNLLLRAFVASGLDTTDLRGVEMRFDLIDNALTTPFQTKKSPAREVAFKATIIKGGVEVSSMSVTATDAAAEQHLLAKESALAVSFHEMGHASFQGLSPELLRALGYKNAANISMITGRELQYVTIRGGKMGNIKYYGYARSTPIAGAMLNPDHDKVVIMIAELWAGMKAQQLAGYNVDAGWGNDLEKIRRIAFEYFTTWGLDREFVGLPVDKDGKPVVPPIKQARFDEKFNALLSEGERLAETVVRLRWDFIGATSIELMKRGEINRERLTEIDAKVTAMKAVGRRVPNPRREPISPEAAVQGHSRAQMTVTCEDLFR